MPFDHAAAEAQIAACVAEFGDTWRIGSLLFTGVIENRARPDGLGGTAFDLELTVTRSLLGTELPGEGASVVNTRTGVAYRLIDHRPGDLGCLILVVTSCPR